MSGPTPGAQPVQGPSQPTGTDLIWATASSQAALNDSGLSVQDRLTYLEAEAATYIAAAHLGVDGGTPEHHATGPVQGLGAPTASSAAAMADPEPDAETVGPAWHPAYYDARDAGHGPDAAEAIADQAQAELAAMDHAARAMEDPGDSASLTERIAAEAQCPEPEAGL